MSKKSSSSFSWGTALRAAVTAAILTWFAMKLNWKELGSQFVQADWRWLLAACCLLGGALLCIAARWQTLLKIQAITLSFKPVVALTFIGQFFNIFLPGSVGGDVIKIFYILKYAPHRKARAALSIVMDRFFGICVLLTLAAATLPWQLRLMEQNQEMRAVMWTLVGTLAALAAFILLLAALPFHRSPPALRALWHRVPKREILESLVAGFRQHGKSPRLTLIALGYCLAVHLLGFSMSYCLARGLHLHASFFQMMVILAIVYMLMALPISINGHGVREFGAAQMFALYGLISVNPVTGAGQEPAVVFGLLLFGVNLVWGLVGGVVYLTFQHHEKAVAHHASA
ncbi:MAG: lysylphosphatidylglycerol synthase transmembrane domain-containing protein [bacterium]